MQAAAAVQHEEGSQQGCPLGGLLFVLSVAAIAEDVAARYPSVTVLGFADDYRFIGPVRDALDAALEYRTRVIEAGHVDQVEKAWAFSPSQASIDEAMQHPLAGIVSASGGRLRFAGCDTGLRTVGAPVGSNMFRSGWYLEYIESQVQPLLDAISELALHDNDLGAQSAFIILKYCAATKFSYLLRTAPPDLIEEATTLHDDRVLQCLASILDHAHPRVLDEGHSPSAAVQAVLPTDQGGLGLSSSAVTSAPAYVAGWIDFLRFCDSHPSLLPALAPSLTSHALLHSPLPDIASLRTTWAVLSDRLSRDDPDSGDSIGGVPEMQGVLGSAISNVSCLASARASSQRGLTKLCSRALEREWRKVASVTDCIRLTECGGHEAQWVTRCPTRPEFCMKSHLWRVAILVRLALPLERMPACFCMLTPNAGVLKTVSAHHARGLRLTIFRPKEIRR